MKIEEFKTEKITDSKKQIFDKFKDHDKYKGICEQEETYTQQLATYLRAYTKGMLHERIVKTPVEDICEMLRDIIHKGKNRNKAKIIALKSEVLSPPRASTVKDIQKIVTEWKH